MIQINRTNSDNTEFQQLVQLLDQDLAIRDGDEHAFYAQFNKTAMIKHVLVAYNQEKPIACGAFKNYDDTTVEIKRMYVLPAYRGQGIAGQILKALENWALELNYTSCVLETGKNQPEAIRLYHKSGYQIIPNYGQYIGINNSVCFKKEMA